MNLWKEKFQHLQGHPYVRHMALMWRQSWWIFVLSLAVVLSAVWDLWPSAEDQPASTQAALDTFIPRGYVLVPVELSNHRAVSALLGAYGVVDLYPARDQDTSPYKQPRALRHPVARQVRIVRSPHSASHFAVLVPQNAATQLMDLGARFHAVLQNPDDAPRLEIPSQASHSIQIVVEDEEKLNK